MRKRTDLLYDYWRRAVTRRGPDRETVMVVVKCVLSAVAAWGIGMVAVDTTQVGFAPFTALLVVRPSVYGSVLQSTRYVAAVFTGALLAGVAGLSVGAQLWSFGIVVLVALVLGHLRFFREQGKQVSVVAAFALAGGAASSGEQLGELLLMVAIGSLCALVVNMLLAPAIRFRDAQEGVLDFVDALRYVVEGIAEDLRNGLETEAVGQRVRAAEALDNTSRNAQAVVERQEYRVRLNPRKVFSRARVPIHLDSYRLWIGVFDRASRHTESITLTLQHVTEGYARKIGLCEDFWAEYVELLDMIAHVLDTLHTEDQPEWSDLSGRTAQVLGEAFDRVVQSRRTTLSDAGDEMPARAALLTDAERLLQEIDQGREGARHMSGT